MKKLLEYVFPCLSQADLTLLYIKVYFHIFFKTILHFGSIVACILNI